MFVLASSLGMHLERAKELLGGLEVEMEVVTSDRNPNSNLPPFEPVYVKPPKREDDVTGFYTRKGKKRGKRRIQ